MDKKAEAKKFKQFVKKHKNLYIQTHDFPDPDAIASAYATSVLMKQLGCETSIIYCGEITRAITIEMIKRLHIKLLKAEDISFTGEEKILVLDGRIDNENITRMNANYIGTIDHHRGTNSNHTEEYSDIRPSYGSTSTIIAEYYKHLTETIPPPVATALAIGLNTDTFRLLRDFSLDDLEIYPYLYQACDKNYLQYVLLNNIEIQDLQFFKRAIAQLDTQNRFGTTDLKQLDNSTLLAIICDFMLSLKELDVVLTMAHTKKSILLSIRSEKNIYSAASIIKKILAGMGNGGGHKTMAAGVVPLNKDGDIEQLKTEIKERFFAIQNGE